jgi:hypothetical protein
MAFCPQEVRTIKRGAKPNFTFRTNICEAVFRMPPQVIDSNGKTE